MKFGQSARKVEQLESVKDAPGPGNYDQKEQWNNENIYTTIKGKREVKVEEQPGPGEYSQEGSSMLMASQGNTRIGRAERKHIWEQQVK